MRTPQHGATCARVGAVATSARNVSREPTRTRARKAHEIPANQPKRRWRWGGGFPFVTERRPNRAQVRPSTRARRPLIGPSPSPPKASLRRPTRSGASSSSSCAQTAERHPTVSVPRCSRSGVASCATTSPATSAQHPCTRASSVAGAADRAASSSAALKRRGARRLKASRPWPYPQPSDSPRARRCRMPRAPGRARAPWW